MGESGYRAEGHGYGPTSELLVQDDDRPSHHSTLSVSNL